MTNKDKNTVQYQVTMKKRKKTEQYQAMTKTKKQCNIRQQ